MSLFTELLNNFEDHVKYCNNGILAKAIECCDNVLGVSVFTDQKRYCFNPIIGSRITYRNGRREKITVPVDEFFHLNGDYKTDVEKLSIATVEKLFEDLPLLYSGKIFPSLKILCHLDLNAILAGMI
jgi:hypothetical protein